MTTVQDLQDLKVNITIPTYNRAFCLRKAIDGALGQSYHNVSVTVVDDGSTDETRQVVERYFSHPNFCYLKLSRNVGTANAKNVSILLSDYDAITFHDSDDLPDVNKVLMQARALAQPGHVADPILDWPLMGYRDGQEMDVDIVVGAHDMVKLNGSVHRMAKCLSLIDDFFPTLQFPSKTEGDWILINSGLFRKRVFEEVGGYLDSVEEDRELRNRTLGCGFLYYYLEQPLLTKIEMPASLTVDEVTGYRGDKRVRDRNEVRSRTRTILKNFGRPELRRELRAEIDLSGVNLSYVSNPDLLTFNERVPHTRGTREALTDAPEVAGVAR